MPDFEKKNCCYTLLNPRHSFTSSNSSASKIHRLSHVQNFLKVSFFCLMPPNNALLFTKIGNPLLSHSPPILLNTKNIIKQTLQILNSISKYNLPTSMKKTKKISVSIKININFILLVKKSSLVSPNNFSDNLTTNL